MASAHSVWLCCVAPCLRHGVQHFHKPTRSASSILQQTRAASFLFLTKRWTVSKRFYSRSADFDQDQEESEAAESDIEWLNNPEYKAEFADHYLLPTSGHSVAIIQPEFKESVWKCRLTSPTLQLSEAVALIHTLPRWTVVDKAIYQVRHMDKRHIWGKGNFADITQRLRETPGVTAVLVGVNMLTGLQLATMQKAWGIPIYDRYTVVLQIFQVRARTKEAKLQVALAEIPYLRSRLRGVHRGVLGWQGTDGGLFGQGASSQMPMDAKKQMLRDREIKLKAALQKIKNQRELLKKKRKRRQIPSVAVVGYTNAGKTSLIRALSGDVNVQPRNQLFATLDVTVHEATLPNRMTVLLIDTVGFISDIPTDLIASFSATLGDMLEADVIIVVNDISHPDLVWQQRTVKETLNTLQLPQELADNIIEVNNKADLLESAAVDDNEVVFPISTVTGQGLLRLQMLVEDAVIKSTDRLKKRLRIPQNGQHLSWLYKEATVGAISPGDADSLIVDVVMTTSAYERFKQQFNKQRKTNTPAQ